MFGKLRIPLSPDPQFCSTQSRHSFFSPGHGSVAPVPEGDSGVRIFLACVVHLIRAKYASVKISTRPKDELIKPAFVMKAS
ncbi:hypothetical protein NPIL_352451 [Nephila pilipes]|uniref:Uncharacterized protein n=1 Tax=Nephila pilipes TaxID=299642 RepID=A0A8X6UAK0_NEPPI|nr:hypothetical protein NPIL_352451 [Nephila pilipes]